MPGVAGRLCHGYGVCTSRGTVPYRTVPYRTTPCLTLQQEHTAKHILPCLSQRKPGGKKAAVGNRRKCGKLCGKLVARRSGRCGRARAQRWTGAAREGVDAVGQTPVLAAAGCGGAWGRADRGDVRVRQGLLVGHSLACAFGRAQSGACFGRCGCGGRFWLARCGGRAVRDAGAAQSTLAGFLSERKNA